MPSPRQGQTVAIIPARGGSKGIVAKNLRPLGGRPLVSWTIDAARRTPEVDRVVVSTDDAEIAAVASAAGAEVIDRPAALSGDAASSESALLHALDVLRSRNGYEPELVVFLQATSPLRAPGDIAAAIRRLRAENADSLLSVSAVHTFVWRREGGVWNSLNYDYRHRVRRQDSPEDVLENGSIYVFRPWVLRETGNRLGGRIAVYEMDPLNSFQVDRLEDLALMERLVEARVGALPPIGRVRLLVLDFDGVMTDDRVFVDQDGREAVFCHRGDGLGIGLLRQAGIEVVVLSTETNPVVGARCRKLGLEFVQGCADKLVALKALAVRKGIDREEIGYVGNDVNDLGCLRWVGLPLAVANAVAEVRRAARYVSVAPGGFGAVREICDRLFENVGSTSTGQGV